MSDGHPTTTNPDAETRPTSGRIAGKPLSKEVRAQIVLRYLATNDAKRVARELNITYQTVVVRLREAGVFVSKYEPTRLNYALTDEAAAEVARRYLAGESSTALGSEFGVSTGTVRAAVRRVGGSVPDRATRSIQEQRAAERLAVQLRVAGHEPEAIAEQIGRKVGFVKAALKKAGTPVPRRDSARINARAGKVTAELAELMAGADPHEIALRSTRSASSILIQARRRGLPSRVKGRPADRSRAIEMANTGASLADVACAVGVIPVVVARWLNEAEHPKTLSATTEAAVAAVRKALDAYNGAMSALSTAVTAAYELSPSRQEIEIEEIMSGPVNASTRTTDAALRQTLGQLITSIGSPATGGAAGLAEFAVALATSLNAAND